MTVRKAQPFTQAAIEVILTNLHTPILKPAQITDVILGCQAPDGPPGTSSPSMVWEESVPYRIIEVNKKDVGEFKEQTPNDMLPTIGRGTSLSFSTQFIPTWTFHKAYLKNGDLYLVANFGSTIDDSRAALNQILTAQQEGRNYNRNTRT